MGIKNHKSTKAQKLVYFLIFLFSYFLFIAQPVLAATVLSPVLELEGDAGKTVNGAVKLYNETDQNLNLVSSVEQFKAGDESGKPVYVPAGADNSFLQWFTVGKNTVTIPPKYAMLVPFTVKIPPQAVPGGYYAVIFWQTAASPNPNNADVSVSGKVGTLVLLTVKGQLSESGQVKEFATRPGGNYFWQTPLGFLVRFANAGNVHLAPSGTIEIQGWFGRKEILNINSDQHNVLPGSTRRYEIVWQNQPAGKNLWQSWWLELKQEFNHFTFGHYTATLRLTFGSNNQLAAVKPISFWFIPINLIITALVLLVILIILLKFNFKINRLKRTVSKLNDSEK